MSILDLHADEQVQASLNTAPAPVAPPAKFSAWSAIPRGIAVAAGEVGASAADLVNAARVFRDTPSREIAASGLPTSAYSSELGDTVRKYWDDFRPDPNTASTAEQVLFGFSRGLAKVVPATIAAGPVGAIVAGIEEGMTVSDELRRKGVGADARTKAGMIQGAGLASAALPLLGTTLAETAALYVAGGPGGFMAQQALTREILRDAGHDQIAAGYDPFDPVGLAVASLIPAGFTAYGLRGQVKAARAKAAADFNAGPVPSEPTPVAAAVADAYKPAPPRIPPEVVDAAMVQNTRDFAAAQTPAVVAHAEAWRGPVTENPNFKAWFGDSKVVGEDGAPMVVYHGTTRSFDTFDPNAPRTALPLPGIFFSPHPEIASAYAAIGREIRDADGFIVGAEGGNTVPVYLSIKNPILLRYDDRNTGRMTSYKTVEADLLAARKAGHDGAIIEGWTDGSGPMQYVAFHPEQIKSAIGNSGRFDPNSASLTDPVPRAAATEAAQARIDATPTEASIGGLETREVPVKDITLSEDVPQFKSDANARGVVEPLGGSFDRTGVAPIQLWERTDGRLEVISGRHRLDLAQRSGEATIPAQVHREADGFGARQAAALDAELNIRDGQGKVRDYVDYFSATGIDRATAEQRGLLARSIGKRAFAIANDGSPELIAAHRAGIVTDEAAVAIAGAAPGDSRLQAVGIRAVQDGKTIGQAANTVRAVKLLAGDRPAVTGDMFGFDDSAMREAESMAKIATAKQREVQTRLSAISGAAKRPELAKAEGVNIKDAAAVLRRVEELRAESAAWENWTTNPALVEAIRAELHPDGAPLLQAHSADDLAAKAARESDAPRLDEKAQIDAEREHFQLVQQAVEGREDTTGDMFGDPIAKLNEPADAKPKPAADPIMSTVAMRVADLESTAPDMVVRIAEDGKAVTLADDIAEVRRMVAEGTDDSLGTLDADLMRVAVECALSTGG